MYTEQFLVMDSGLAKNHTKYGVVTLKRSFTILSVVVLGFSIFGWLWYLPVKAIEPVVHAVLFYSPNCGHCHIVINESLIPLIEEYGEQLQIVGVDVSQPSGQALFQTAIQKFGLNQAGVPFLVVGDHYLVGSRDIPEQFPGLIENYLSQDGVDWPAIPGLVESLNYPDPQPDPTSEVSSDEPTNQPSMAGSTESAPMTEKSDLAYNVGDAGRLLGIQEKMALEPWGNGLVVAVLLAMLFSVTYLSSKFYEPISSYTPSWHGALIPALCLVGLVVAGYQAYVETNQIEAVCGPVGDCNTVQSSEYAQLFGIHPIGVLGVVGYVVILATWIAAQFTNSHNRDISWLVIFAMALIGTIFSIYLTFLEPFVIGATCAWCLSSAAIMTALLWLTYAPGKKALTNLIRFRNN